MEARAGVWACATEACGSGGGEPVPGPFPSDSRRPPVREPAAEEGLVPLRAACAVLGAMRLADPRLSAFWARGEKAQRIAPAHYPPTSALDPGRARWGPEQLTLGTGVLHRRARRAAPGQREGPSGK